jgi:hypothetical protein
MNRLVLFTILVAGLLAAPGVLAAAPKEPIPAAEAAAHVGEKVTVCGTVAGAAHFERMRGEPTFLNFDRPYPAQSFTVVIWGENNRKFERPPHQFFSGKDVCVTGTVESYKGKPQIEVRDPSQITVTAPLFDADRFSAEERVLLKALLSGLGHPADIGSATWDAEADQSLRAFQQGAGLEAEGERSPQTLRALAEAVDRLPDEEKTRILRLVLLNLAQREESAATKEKSATTGK